MRLAAKAMPGLRHLFESGPDSSEGERLLQLGNFQEAERFFDQLLESTKSRPGRKGRQGRVLLALAKARWEQEKYPTSLEAAKSALPELEDAGPAPELVECLDLLARLQIEREHIADAIPHFERALAVQQKIRPLDQAAVIQRQRKLADAFGQAGTWDKALAASEAAAQIAEKECGPTHRLTGDCLSDLGRCQTENGNHVTAKLTLERALEVHTSLCGGDSEEVARDYQSLASACQAAEDFEHAVHYYEKALRLRERQLGGNSADFADLLMNLAGAHSLQGHYGPAVELLQQAVGKFEGTRDRRLGPALESLGTVYLLCGRVEDSIRSLKKARKIWEAAPDRHQAQLESNRQLFETVGSYLNTKDAANLLGSIHGATVEDATYSPTQTPQQRPAAALPPQPVFEAPLPMETVYPAAFPTAPASFPQPPQGPGISFDPGPLTGHLTEQLTQLSTQLAYLAQQPGPTAPAFTVQSGQQFAVPHVPLPSTPPAGPPAAPPQSAYAPNSVPVTFVMADGSPADLSAFYHASASAPLQVVAATHTPHPAPGPAGAFALGGWEDMGFELLSAA